MDRRRKPPTSAIMAAHEQLVKSLPMQDEQDFEDARRGLLGALEPGVVRNQQGDVVWDADSYGFLSGAAPTTVTRASGGSRH